MSFRIHALPAERYAALHALDARSLVAHAAARVIADHCPGYPCRVSLQDAEVGETLILVSHVHQEADTPYRAAGPIYIRAWAQTAVPAAGEVPALLRTRLLSLRGYTAAHGLKSAEVCEGAVLEAGIAQLFADDEIAYLHLHFAKPGCYACSVTREAVS